MSVAHALSAVGTPSVLAGMDPAGLHRAEDRLRILCILPTMNPYGGVISVVNLAEQWLDMGHRVTIACLSHNQTDVLHSRIEPLHVPDRSRIPDVLGRGNYDILLATSWETVDPIVELAGRMPGAAPFYFVQGIEMVFIPPRQRRRRQEVLDTYGKIPTRIVKTRHLQSQLEAMGHDAALVSPGMNLDIFYPHDVPKRDSPRVLAMARPDAPGDHRGFKILVEVYRRLAAARPEVELALFGARELPALDFPYVDYGVVPPWELPHVYSSADVYVDVSRQHGFGRTGVEAMACGVPCVLSDSGGISDYAKDGENALIVPVADIEGTVAAVERLFDDSDLARTLQARAVSDVQPFSDRTAAKEMLVLFEEMA